MVRALNQIRQKRGVPKLIFCDNGSEFTSQIMDLWAYHNRVQIDFSRPGKPTDNAHVESFNGTLRAECLDVHWFATLTEAKQVIEDWRQEYNESRPSANWSATKSNPHTWLGAVGRKRSRRCIAARRFRRGLCRNVKPFSLYRRYTSFFPTFQPSRFNSTRIFR